MEEFKAALKQLMAQHQVELTDVGGDDEFYPMFYKDGAFFDLAEWIEEEE